MSIGKYEVFHAVTELGSLTRASEALNISQSGVSHAIASLEKELGFSLLTRNKAGIKLTANGERMLLYIREILYLNDKMHQEASEIKGLEIGTVRIGTFTSITSGWLPGILQRFKKQYPHIKVELLEGKQEDIERAISHGVVDFGFLLLPSVEAFEVLHLKKESLYCILSDTHPLRDLAEMVPGDLKSEHLILQNSTREKVLKICKLTKISPNIAFHLEDEQAIIALVKQSLGVGILPEIAVSCLPSDIKKIPLRHKEAFSSIGIAALSLKGLAPAAEKFIASATLWLNDQY